MTDEQQMVTAQRLRDGAVVFLTKEAEWSERVDDAALASHAEELERAALADVAANRVVDVRVIPARRDGDRVVPARYRERLRAVGPTVRPDLRRPGEI